MALLCSHGLNSESLDLVTLLRVKYIQLRTKKYLSKFLKSLVFMFNIEMNSFIFEYTDSMYMVWIWCANVLLVYTEHWEDCLFGLTYRFCWKCCGYCFWIELSGFKLWVGNIVLCSWVIHLTITVPVFTQMYKWVVVNLLVGVMLWWTVSHLIQGGVEIYVLPVAP